MNDTADELGIYSDVPFLARFLKVAGIVNYALFINKLSYFAWDLIWVVACSLILSSELREHFTTWVGSVAIIATLIIVTVVWGALIIKLFPLINRILLGPPVFGELGGPPRKTFFTLLKCAATITYKFNPKDSKLVNEFNNLDTVINEAMLKESFRIHHYGADTKNIPDDFDENWARFWNEEILTLRTGTMTYKDILKPDKFASRLLPFKLDFISRLAAILVKLAQILLLYFAALFATDSIELVSVIQVGLLVSFLISIYLFVMLSNQLLDIPFLGFGPAIPRKIKDKFADKVNPFVGKTVTPTEINVKKGYLSIVRDYILRNMMGSLLNTILLLILLALCFITARIWIPESLSTLALWVNKMYIAVLIIPIALVLGYYATFWLLQSVKYIIAPLVAGIVAAILPFVLTYIVTGKLDINIARDTITSAILGSTALITTAITSMIRKRIEE